MNVGVRLNVNEPTSGTYNLAILLASPQGATTTLISGEGAVPGAGLGSGPPSCRGGTTTFDDEAKRFVFAPLAPNPLTDNPSNAEFTLHPPYTGRIHSDGATFDLFRGLRAQGTWRLTLLNAGTTERATLICWRLRIKPQRPTGTTT